MTLDDGFGRSVTRGAGLAVGVGLVAGLVLLGIAAGHVLILMLVAVILASGLQPFVAWIRGHVPIGRGPTILLVYGAFLAVVVGMALIVLPVAIAQLERTMASLPPFFQRAREWATTISPPGLSRSVTTLIDSASRALQPPPNAAPAPGQVVQVGLTLAETVTSLLTLLTVVYFWLTEHARLQRYALAFVPADRRKRARDVWNAAETRLGMWVRGELILMATIGVATAVTYTLLGVPAALLLGLIAAIAEAIPIVGPLLGAIPAVLVAATVSPQLALAVGGAYLVLQLIEGNFLVPLVMRNTVGISPFLVILSVLIGGAAGGFIGALLAVPIAAVGEVLIEGLQAREIPVAQGPTATETTADESNAADEPDAGTGSRGAARGTPASP
ncbi:MAG TPA: AI-2E family transporter [Candidatus Limnocylindrales bacterium]|nr:AI-2E family transporter [Candidatus Limnocylindrales bacterium]